MAILAGDHRPTTEEIRAALDLLRSHKRELALQVSETAGILHIPLEVEGLNDPEAGWESVYSGTCRLHSVIACTIREREYPEEGLRLSIELDLKPAKRVLTEEGVALLLAEAERDGARWWHVPAGWTEFRLTRVRPDGHEDLAFRLLRIAEFHSFPAEE